MTCEMAMMDISDLEFDFKAQRWVIGGTRSGVVDLQAYVPYGLSVKATTPSIGKGREHTDFGGLPRVHVPVVSTWPDTHRSCSKEGQGRIRVCGI